eukprot:4282415-Amphidinium_carterae.1
MTWHENELGHLHFLTCTGKKAEKKSNASSLPLPKLYLQRFTIRPIDCNKCFPRFVDPWTSPSLLARQKQSPEGRWSWPGCMVS